MSPLILLGGPSTSSFSLYIAYDWSGDEIFLEKANDLGTRLFPAVSKAPLGIAYGQVNLATGDVHNIQWAGNNAITAEFTTTQIEYRMLARLTGNAEFKQKSERMFEIIKDMNPPDGLYPNFIQNEGARPEWGNQKLTFGAMGDSLYEYMLKIWLQGGKTEPMYREMYDRSIQGMHDELLQLSSPSGLVYIADKNNGKLDTKMDHLVCFMGTSTTCSCCVVLCCVVPYRFARVPYPTLETPQNVV